MTTYRNLDLKAIRSAAGLDFAHFTYQKGQCSCCFGPLDLPALYWEGGKATKEKFASIAKETQEHPYSYILFKNAFNGSGTVTKEDTIGNHTYISYGNLTDEQMTMVVEMLQNQLGDDYSVIKPESQYKCIEIHKK